MFIPVNEPYVGAREKELLAECIDTGWISSEGPFVSKFETMMAERVRRKHAITCANGTAALDLAIESLELTPGAEVIVPTFTIISCISHIVRKGLIPVFVDCNPFTWNTDAEEVVSCITEKTRAILIVHIYGLVVDYNAIKRVADEYNIPVIEDAAEAIGAKYRERLCGSLGVVSTMSFYPNKHITTGEGGMVLTDDDEKAELIRGLRNLCFQNSQRFKHERIGWNYRMTNLQAALGIAQLERLDATLKRKREIGMRYRKNLEGLKQLRLAPSETEFCENCYWVFGIVLLNTGFNAREFMSLLSDKGIGSRPFFYPLHQQPVLKEENMRIGGSMINSEYIGEYGLYLPSGITITDGEIDQVCEVVKHLARA